MADPDRALWSKMPARKTDESPTYADRLRTAMEMQFGPRTPSLRELAGQVGYSTEQIRKVLRGVPVVSEKLNRAFCKYLHLNEAEMWDLARREKPSRRSPSDRWAPKNLAAAWAALSVSDRELIRKLIVRLGTAPAK